MPSQCSAEYALGIPEVCIELTSAVLEPPLKCYTVFSNTDGRGTRLTLHLDTIGEQNIYHAVTLDNQQINSEDTAMDKDRIKGSAQQAKGVMKEVAGKAFGDEKLETEGRTDKAAGKVQNAIGGLKDAVRGK